MLETTPGRKDDVRQLSRPIHEHIDHHQKIQFFQRLLHPVGVHEGDERVS